MFKTSICEIAENIIKKTLFEVICNDSPFHRHPVHEAIYKVNAKELAERIVQELNDERRSNTETEIFWLVASVEAEENRLEETDSFDEIVESIKAGNHCGYAERYTFDVSRFK